MQEYQGDTRKKILDSMDESAFVHTKKKVRQNMLQIHPVIVNQALLATS